MSATWTLCQSEPRHRRPDGVDINRWCAIVSKQMSHLNPALPVRLLTASVFACFVAVVVYLFYRTNQTTVTNNGMLTITIVRNLEPMNLEPTTDVRSDTANRPVGRTVVACSPRC